jgi:hypothetical protein
MDRRAFLRSLAGLGAVAVMGDGWVMLEGGDPPKVGSALLDGLESINRHFAVQREAVPPALLRQGLVDHLDYLRGLLGQSLPDHLQARLLTITSDAARRVAWNSYQMGCRRQARADLQLAQSPPTGGCGGTGRRSSRRGSAHDGGPHHPGRDVRGGRRPVRLDDGLVRG